MLADDRDVAALARDFLRDSVEPDQPPLEGGRAVQIQNRLGALGADELPLRRFGRRLEVEVVADESVDARRRAGGECGGVDHRERREDRVMPVEAHALTRHPEEIGRVALGDEVGAQSVPHHQDDDTAAPAMCGSVLRANRRSDSQQNQERENFGQLSSGEHQSVIKAARDQLCQSFFAIGFSAGSRGCALKKSQMTSVALRLSLGLPTNFSGSRLVPPGQMWPSPLTL